MKTTGLCTQSVDENNRIMYTVCRWQQQDYAHSTVDDNNRIMYTVCIWQQQDYVHNL